MRKNLDPIEELKEAVSESRRTFQDCGKIRGGAGGWRAEAMYQAASARLYDARIANGFEMTKRSRDGTHYILSIPKGLENY